MMKSRRRSELSIALRSNCAEGAGAAVLAGLIKEREQFGRGRAAVVASGHNIDRAWLQTVLAGPRRQFIVNLDKE